MANWEMGFDFFKSYELNVSNAIYKFKKKWSLSITRDLIGSNRSSPSTVESPQQNILVADKDQWQIATH